MYANDFFGIEKPRKTILDCLLKATEDIGSSNVLQIVTDNIKNCQPAGKEIGKIHKHIFSSPCVCHTLNLIFK